MVLLSSVSYWGPWKSKEHWPVLGWQASYMVPLSGRKWLVLVCGFLWVGQRTPAYRETTSATLTLCQHSTRAATDNSSFHTRHLQITLLSSLLICRYAQYANFWLSISFESLKTVQGHFSKLVLKKKRRKIQYFGKLIKKKI